ncbi:MAG: hypothetical protein NVS1B4_25320 [Gemmatimonadaceae bacterium]
MAPLGAAGAERWEIPRCEPAPGRCADDLCEDLDRRAFDGAFERVAGEARCADFLADLAAGACAVPRFDDFLAALFDALFAAGLLEARVDRVDGARLGLAATGLAAGAGAGAMPPWNQHLPIVVWAAGLPSLQEGLAAWARRAGATQISTSALESAERRNRMEPSGSGGAHRLGPCVRVGMSTASRGTSHAEPGYRRCGVM